MFIGTFPGMGSTVATTTPTGLECTELKGWAAKQQIAPERQKGDATAQKKAFVNVNHFISPSLPTVCSSLPQIEFPSLFSHVQRGAKKFLHV